jgi:hypothetical protein
MVGEASGRRSAVRHDLTGEFNGTMIVQAETALRGGCTVMVL